MPDEDHVFYILVSRNVLQTQKLKRYEVSHNHTNTVKKVNLISNTYLQHLHRNKCQCCCCIEE